MWYISALCHTCDKVVSRRHNGPNELFHLTLEITTHTHESCHAKRRCLFMRNKPQMDHYTCHLLSHVTWMKESCHTNHCVMSCAERGLDEMAGDYSARMAIQDVTHSNPPAQPAWVLEFLLLECLNHKHGTRMHSHVRHGSIKTVISHIWIHTCDMTIR